MKKLTTRQWKLYNYIKEHGVVSVEDICRDMPDLYTLATSDRIHNKCAMVFTDADALNASQEIEKIIIHDRNYNFWLAKSYEEAVGFAEHLYKKRALTALKKYWNMLRKASADGQGKIISCHGDVIDEHSHARAFVEAFVKESSEENEKD